MVLMTQVGYTDNMDFSIGLNQDTESKDTGGSTPALTPSGEGADLMVGDLMDEITFQYLQCSKWLRQRLFEFLSLCLCKQQAKCKTQQSHLLYY